MYFIQVAFKTSILPILEAFEELLLSIIATTAINVTAATVIIATTAGPRISISCFLWLFQGKIEKLNKKSDRRTTDESVKGYCESSS